MTDQIITEPEYPQCTCPNCRSRKAESVALATLARLLKAALLSDEPPLVIRFHALMLVQMGEARGMW